MKNVKALCSTYLLTSNPMESQLKELWQTLTTANKTVRLKWALDFAINMGVHDLCVEIDRCLGAYGSDDGELTWVDDIEALGSASV